MGLILPAGVYPLCPTLDTVGPMARSVADVAQMWSVLTGRPVPEPRLAGLNVGLIRQPPGIGDGRPTERSDLVDGRTGDPSAWGRGSPKRLPEPSANHLRPQFQHEAAQSHAATFPSRADEYGALMRKKLEAARRVRADDVAAAYDAIAAWRRFEPDVDLYVSPCYAVELPEDADELDAVAADLVPPLGEPDRLGRARDRGNLRQPIAPHRRGRARSRPRLGAGAH